MSTCRFISSGGKDSGQDYRARGAVDHTTAGEHQRLDQFCPSDGQPTPNQERIRPGNLRGLLSKPGKTGFKSVTPMCLVRISPTTERKSVVSARSRPSLS